MIIPLTEKQLALNPELQATHSFLFGKFATTNRAWEAYLQITGRQNYGLTARQVQDIIRYNTISHNLNSVSAKKSAIIEV